MRSAGRGGRPERPPYGSQMAAGEVVPMASRSVARSPGAISPFAYPPNRAQLVPTTERTHERLPLPAQGDDPLIPRSPSTRASDPRTDRGSGPWTIPDGPNGAAP
ncbi:hypothetical protein GCM10009608_66020 [Pseudonocardia alaniniphila]